MEPSKDPARLVEIMKALREPETGCPWDVEQTFESIVPYTLEEAYEVADAIAQGDMSDLEEELGDLLLQVVYHAQMAEEAGHFSFGDVVNGVTTKMIRRHPHVFGDLEARTAGMAKGTWERIKSEEKAEKAAKRAASGQAPKEGRISLLNDIPSAHPALVRALKIQSRVSKVGFDWNDAGLVLDKIEEEIAEVREAIADNQQAKIADEMGDLLFTVVNLARHLEVDAEDALRGCNRKVERRFHHIESRLAKDGKDIKSTPLDEMESLWVEAKELERKID